MQLPIRRCPYCGGTDIRIGYQNYEAMIVTGPNSMRGCRVRHLICGNCGSVLHSKVAKPQMYLKATEYNY